MTGNTAAATVTRHGGRHGALGKLVQTPDWNEDINKNHWVNNYLGSADSRALFAAQYVNLRGVLADLLTK